MGVRVMGGYDTATGWPPDDSTGVEFQDDVEIPGQFRGGGAGFRWGDTDLPGKYGPGGFRVSPRITPPVTGAQGTSLSGVPRGGGAPAQGGPDIFGPQRQNLRPGMSPAVRTGPGASTDATFAPGKPIPGAAPRPWWLPNLTPFGLGAAAGGAAIGGIANENQPGNVPAHGTGPDDVLSPQAIYDRQHPQTADPGFTPNFVRPEGEIQRTFPMWPTPGPGMPSAAATPLPPSRPATPMPVTARGTPSAAGPAAVAQQPNLGNYGASPFTTLDYRPNSGPNERNRGSPVATALDLSRLFGGGGQPAPAAAAAAPPSILARPDLAQRVPLSKTPLPPPKPKKKSSSSSQGGGY
jgi:hypothetical protein